MALLTQFGTTTTTNTNLTTATLVHTQVNTTRVRYLFINLFADQIKGGGDYTAYIRVRRANAGSYYESIKTTKTVTAGITSIYFGSIPVTLNATDLLEVWLLGLATDNDTTADIIVDVNEEWINIDTSGRVDLGAILGSAITGTAANIVAAFTKFFDKASPTGTINSLPDVVPGLAAGLPTVAAGALKLAQTVDLTDATGAGLTALPLMIWNVLEANVGIVADSFGAKLHLMLVNASGFVSSILMRWKTDDAAGTPVALTSANLVQADTIKEAGAVPNNLAAGAAMDLVDALKNKVGASGYDRTKDSLEALGESAGGDGGLCTITDYPVTDSVTGLPVLGATAELYPTDAYTGIIQKQISDALGLVTFSNLKAKRYYIKVIRAGYEDFYDSEVAA
jgi:hypothetical protein